MKKSRFSEQQMVKILREADKSPVAQVAKKNGISEQTIYAWRRQARIDAGQEVGITTAEQAELAAAKRRIRELETELAIHRRATELLKETSRPKARTRRSE